MDYVLLIGLVGLWINKKMKQTFVNKIEIINGITHGYAVLSDTVSENLSIMFSKGTFETVAEMITNSPEDQGYSLDRFCQFVVFTQI